MADLGDAFLSSLQTGLNIARSYRDETRLNEEIERKNRRDALLDKLALNQDARAAAAEARLQDDYGFQKSRRPTILKADEIGLKTSEAQLQGLNIDNEWKPKRYAADVDQSRASAASSRASAAYTGVLANNARIQGSIASLQLNEALRSRETATVISQLSDPGFDASKVPTSMVPQLLAVTGLTQAAQTARGVLGQVARGDWSWAQNENTVRQVQFFLRPEARRSATQRGFDPNSADITSFSLTKNGVVVNYAAKGSDGKFARWSDVLPADKLAAKMDIAGGAADLMRSNPNFRSNILALYQRSDPQGYRQVVSAAGESIDSKIKDLKEAAKGTSPEAAQARKDLSTLAANREAAINSQVLNYLGVVGQNMGQFSSSNNALNKIRRADTSGRLTNDQIVDTANTAIDTVRQWSKGGEIARLRNAGVVPKTYRDPKTPAEMVDLFLLVQGDRRARNILGIR